MAATGIVYLRGWLWLHEPADLDAYVAVPWDDGGHQRTTTADVRVYGRGTTAVVRAAGAVDVVSYQLPDIPHSAVAALLDRAGRLQLVRDWRSAYYGLVAAPAVTYTAPALVTATLDVTQITAPHLIDVL